MSLLGDIAFCAVGQNGMYMESLRFPRDSQRYRWSLLPQIVISIQNCLAVLDEVNPKQPTIATLNKRPIEYMVTTLAPMIFEFGSILFSSSQTFAAQRTKLYQALVILDRALSIPFAIMLFRKERKREAAAMLFFAAAPLVISLLPARARQVCKIAHLCLPPGLTIYAEGWSELKTAFFWIKMVSLSGFIVLFPGETA